MTSEAKKEKNILEITKGENANLAGMEPRCPKCGSNELSIGEGIVECACWTCDWSGNASQFFRSPAPTPPLDVEAEKRITEIRERESKATKGPWFFESHGDPQIEVLVSGNVPDEEYGSRHTPVLLHGHELGESEIEENWEFIQHSRQDIPFLLEQRDSLLEQISLLRRHIASPAPQSKPLDRKTLEAAANELLISWDKDHKFSFSHVTRLMAEFAIEHAHAASPAQPEKRDEWVSVDLRLPTEAPEPPTRNSAVLKSFVHYCRENPELRFWQALRNWSGYHYILAANCSPATFTDDNRRDTFDWEGRRHDEGKEANPVAPESYKPAEGPDF